ncbi:hypothetical protein JCM13664_17320 [Methylothermus subterraneus]
MLLLAACAPTPQPPSLTFAERLERERQELAALRDKWAHGKALVQEGEEAIQAGERLIEQGKQKRAQGEALIAQGKRLMEEAEQDYQARTGTGVSTFPLEDTEK